VVARFTPAILATQEAEIKSGASWFETSPGKKFVIPYLAKTQPKKRAGGVAQGEGPKFKPQYSKKKKKKCAKGQESQESHRCGHPILTSLLEPHRTRGLPVNYISTRDHGSLALGKGLTVVRRETGQKPRGDPR
jgi:hypothetical protein